MAGPGVEHPDAADEGVEPGAEAMHEAADAAIRRAAAASGVLGAALGEPPPTSRCAVLGLFAGRAVGVEPARVALDRMLAIA